MRAPTTDGLTLAVYDLDGAARPGAPVDASTRRPGLLFAHATGFHGHVWAPMAAHLRAAFEPVSFDFRGHGDSDRPGGTEAHWQGYVDDVRAVLALLAGRTNGNDHGAADPHGAPRLAIGHSMGATALLVAEATAPGTFDGIVAYEPIVHPAGAGTVVPGTLPIAEAARRRRATFASLDEARANYAAKRPLDRMAPEALDAYVRHGLRPDGEGGVTLACTPEHEALTFEGSNSIAAWHLLAAVRCPVLVLAGGGSREGPVAIAEPVANELPAGRFHRFADLDHLGPMEAPATVAATVAEFLAPLAGQRST